MNNYNELFTCPVTLTDDKITYLDFGAMPLVNNLNNTKEESIHCDRYPLVVDYYPESQLSMLSVAVDPQILFGHYVYKSGTNKPYIEHCKEMYQYISKIIQVNEGDRFVDIGGNDGTLLTTFSASAGKRIDIINVDPSKNLGDLCRKNSIVTLTKMWSHEVGNWFHGSVKVITSTNVFQHTQDIGGFASGVYHALRDDGIWCLEFPYWKHDLDTNQYDQVYHEHIYYYLLTPLFKLFNDRGFDIIDVSEQKIHGGSLRVISKKKGNSPREIPESVTKILEKEKKYNSNFYEEWGHKINNHIVESKNFITDLKAQGKKIAGFGAAAKGCTFLNATRLDYKFIDYIVDDTDTKQGKFMPGVGIPIVNREHLVKNKPDYILILAHNFADYIINSLKSIYDGKFIVMFPEPTIL